MQILPFQVIDACFSCASSTIDEKATLHSISIIANIMTTLPKNKSVGQLSNFIDLFLQVEIFRRQEKALN